VQVIWGSVAECGDIGLFYGDIRLFYGDIGLFWDGLRAIAVVCGGGCR